MGIEHKRYTLLDAVLIPMKNCRIIALLLFFICIIMGVVPGVLVIVLANFLDAVLDLYSQGGARTAVLTLVTPIFIVVIIMWMSRLLQTTLRLKLVLQLRDKLRTAALVKRSQLCYAHIEDSKKWDLISKVCNNIEDRFAQTYITILDFGSLLIRISTLIVLLSVQLWWAALLMTVCMIPIFIFSKLGGKRTYQILQETQKMHRECDYLEMVLTSRESSNERFLFGFGHKLSKKWHQLYETVRKKELRTHFKYYARTKASGIFTSMITVIVSVALLHPLIEEDVSVGMFMSLIGATFILVDIMTWTLSSYMEQMSNTAEYMKDFTDFAQLEEDGFNVPDAEYKPDFKHVEFRDVWFKYPNTDNWILNGISFKLHKGKRYSIVGLNAAGKTTIIKLLTGLYRDYEGQILINGKELKDYSFSEINAFISAVYQDFAKYHLSIKMNILLSNISDVDEPDEIRLKKVIMDVGLADLIESLQDGVDTKLGKIYENGQDISGGQWQKIALARALYSTAPILLLDEPTAALDPISESRIYHDFDINSKGKTTLLISHRLGSTKLSDEIFVVHEGKVVEHGNHDALMKNEAFYAMLYDTQREWYNER